MAHIAIRHSGGFALNKPLHIVGFSARSGQKRFKKPTWRKIGPENVSGFVAETIMGGLVGDVPPAPNYWKYVREVCDKYDVHLILDEVYCGTGTTG